MVSADGAPVRPSRPTPWSLPPSRHPRRRPDLAWVKLSAVTLLLQRLVIDQSPREGAGVQEQQEQRECPRGRAAVAGVPVLHGRRMLP